VADAVSQIQRLAAAFPRQKTEQETFKAYAVDLAELPPGVLDVAVTRLIRTSDWFPTIHEIRATCAEEVLQLPREPDALAQVDRMVEWTRHPDGGPRPPVDTLVDRAAALAGGYREFRVTDEPAVIRGQFARYYRELRAQAIEAAAVAPAGPSRPRDLAA
jgi:hypothetical protein